MQLLRRENVAKMDVLFKKHPPLKPLLSLSAIVEDWTYRFGPNGISKHMRDEVTEYCAEASSFEQAVKRACASKRPNGKLHNHQSRVPLKAREELGKTILCSNFTFLKNFDDLHDRVEEIAAKIAGIGPITVYDVSVRLGAFCGHPPQSLYLHGGVRIGWKLLLGKRDNRARVPRSELPIEFAHLPTDEIEDALCCYRSTLRPWLVNGYERIGDGSDKASK